MPDLRPLSDYRYHDNLAKYEKLADKGLTYEKVRPTRPINSAGPARPLPLPRRRASPGQAWLGQVASGCRSNCSKRRASCAEPGRPSRSASPCRKGAVFDLGNLRVLSPAGEEVPAQFTATSFWPDDSLKWVLIDFDAPLAARQTAGGAVEFGSAVAATNRPTRS